METILLKRHEHLKRKLQSIYNNDAERHAAPDRGSLMHLPPGLCPQDIHEAAVSAYQRQVYEHLRFIDALESQLARLPYKPFHTHPMLDMRSGEAEKRHELMRRSASAQATLRAAEEHLAFWTDKMTPVTPTFVNRLSLVFEEKRALYVQLVHDYAMGNKVSEW